MNAWYLDTSAFMKLVMRERESAELHRGSPSAMKPTPSCRVTSSAPRHGAWPDLSATTCARRGSYASRPWTCSPSRETFDDAGIVEPPSLRTLDAIHLVAAQSLIPDLRGIVTYDRRLADAATQHGIEVVSPGAD